MKSNHSTIYNHPPNECGVGWLGVSRCYWCFLWSVWKPTVNIDAKSLLLALRNKTEDGKAIFPSIQDTVGQVQKFALRNTSSPFAPIIKMWLLMLWGSGLFWKRHVTTVCTEAQETCHMCDDALSWQKDQPMNGFLNDYPVSSNRTSLAPTIVTFYPAKELSFQFSGSLEFSYSCRQIKALD